MNDISLLTEQLFVPDDEFIVDNMLTEEDLGLSSIWSQFLFFTKI